MATTRDNIYSQLTATDIIMEDIDNISSEKLSELKDCFTTIDVDKSGAISITEFYFALGQMNLYVPMDEVRQMIYQHDTDGGLTLDFREFIKLIAMLDPNVSQEIEINKAFKLFDQDGDGFISRSELEDALSRFGVAATEEEVVHLFDVTDDDKDGFISQTEFKNLLYEPNEHQQTDETPKNALPEPKKSRFGWG